MMSLCLSKKGLRSRAKGQGPRREKGEGRREGFGSQRTETERRGRGWAARLRRARRAGSRSPPLLEEVQVPDRGNNDVHILRRWKVTKCRHSVSVPFPLVLSAPPSRSRQLSPRPLSSSAPPLVRAIAKSRSNGNPETTREFGNGNAQTRRPTPNRAAVSLVRSVYTYRITFRRPRALTSSSR